MQISDAPIKIPEPWAVDADPSYITYPVPTPSQIGIRNGAASFHDGFPPNTFVSLDAGGAGPFGTDYNGILKQITAGLQWFQAGGPATYDSSFQSNIGGYPNGTVVLSAVTAGLYWRSTTDNNVTNPDTGGAGWVNQAGHGSLAAPGYWVFPFGLIIQWTSQNIPSGVLTTVTLPIAFPTGCLISMASYQNAVPPTTGAIGVAPTGLGTLGAYNSSPGNNGCNFIAIGH